MSYKDFKTLIIKLNNYSHAINTASQALGSDLFEGVFGEMFNELYFNFLDACIPYSIKSDDFCEAVGEALYTTDVSEEYLQEIYEKWVKNND